MKILLTGASGFIGRNLQVALEAAGHTVLPVSRRHGTDLAGMLTAADWLPLLAGVDAVINAVGIIGETAEQRFDTLHTTAPIALFDACRQAGIRRVIQISALGADATAFSRYHLSKMAADDYLRSLDLDWFVLRPSLIYGRGGGSATLFARLARLPLLPVVGDGTQLLQPVHIADVVATVLDCLNASHTRQTLDLVGNEAIEYAAWLQRLRAAQGYKPARVLHLPVRLVMAGVYLGQALNPMLRPENIRMLLTGYHGDGRVWYAFTGRAALDFSPALIHMDAAQALRHHGRTS